MFKRFMAPFQEKQTTDFTCFL